MIPYKPQQYTWLELTFGNKWKWVRKLSKAYWVRMEEEGYSWVKFNKDDHKNMKFNPNTKFQIEDYTK
jgi:hypothetical protein